MADAVIPVGIEFVEKGAGLDAINAKAANFFRQYGTDYASAMGGTTTAAAAAAQKQTTTFNQAADQQKQYSILSIKTVEQYRQEWAGQSTSKLLAYEKQLSDQRTNLANQVKKDLFEGQSIKAQHHRQDMSDVSAELAALRQVSIERKEVLTGGAGAIIGQLGVGRNITNLFSAIQSSFGGESKTG
ncbi:MAG TPA: hypothetical protein VGM92_04855, partial [Candidatus Kapabacteria bacterium]